MNNWQTSKVTQFRSGKKEIEIKNKYQGPTKEFWEKLAEQKRKIVAGEKRMRVIEAKMDIDFKILKSQTRKIENLKNKLLGKSKLDIFWEKKTNTPRKIKLLQNKGILVPNQEFYEKLDMKSIEKTVVFYLKRYDSIKFGDKSVL